MQLRLKYIILNGNGVVVVRMARRQIRILAVIQMSFENSNIVPHCFCCNVTCIWKFQIPWRRVLSGLVLLKRIKKFEKYHSNLLRIHNINLWILCPYSSGNLGPDTGCCPRRLPAGHTSLLWERRWGWVEVPADKGVQTWLPRETIPKAACWAFKPLSFSVNTTVISQRQNASPFNLACHS